MVIIVFGLFGGILTLVGMVSRLLKALRRSIAVEESRFLSIFGDVFGLYLSETHMISNFNLNVDNEHERNSMIDLCVRGVKEAI